VFLADALVDQNVGIDRHTDGQHDTRNTRQGQRCADHCQNRHDHHNVGNQRQIGDEAKHAVGHEHETQHQHRANDTGDFTGGHRISTEAWTDRPLLDDGQGCRQCTCAQQDCQIIGTLNVEIARDLSGAAQNRFPDHRCRNHLFIEHDGKRQADILRGCLPEPLTTLGIKAEADDRLVGTLVIPGLRVDQVFTGNQDRTLNEVRDRRVVGCVENFRICRWSTLDRLLHRHRGVHHAEGQLGGLVEQALQTLRIIKPRHLHENPVRTLPLDDRLGRSQLVDTLSHHLDRLRNGG
jgi:hypothetical protein